MKNIVVTFILFTIFSGIIYGQKFSAGGKAGFSIIPLEKQDLNGRVFSPAYQFGVTGCYKINDWFSVSAEINYSLQKKTYKKYDTTSFSQTLAANPLLVMMGVDVSELLDTLGMATAYINDNSYNTTRGEVNLSYISIPVLANFNYKSLYISAGPYISFLISDKAKEEYSQHIPIVESFPMLDTIPFYTTFIGSSFPGYYQPVSTTKQKNKDIKKIDYGVIADISYRLDNHFTLGFRYTQGLCNYRSPEIYKNDYLSSFSFTIGYLIGIKKNDDSMMKW
mgnify:CR=1 FL=1